MAPQAVLGLLESTDCGLTSALAAARLDVAGRNRLPAPAAPGPLVIGLRQLRSPLIYILLAAALTSLVLGEAGDAGFIAVVLVINSLVGGWQEWRAERQRQDLQRLLRFICKGGWEHHAAMNPSSVADVLAEAFEAYLGWDVYRHTESARQA
jgi:magnesium-transporting ATPase (P-type)